MTIDGRAARRVGEGGLATTEIIASDAVTPEIGRARTRKEVARLLTGQTSWTDTIQPPGMLHVPFLRGPQIPTAVRIPKLGPGWSIATRSSTSPRRTGPSSASPRWPAGQTGADPPGLAAAAGVS
jgi:hypothetical protein